MIFTDQACLDLDHKRKMIMHTLTAKIFHLTQGYVIEPRTLLTDTLPKTNIAYMTASVLQSIKTLPDDYFVLTFKQT